jgi:DNA-binding MarR family transcriptional regulator
MKHKTKEESSLLDLLLVFRRSILEHIRKEGLKCDLTFSQAEVLDFIRHSGKETMKSIADYLKITPPSATEIVKEMEKRGLIKRIDDEKDRRIVSIVLTPAAEKLFVSLHKRKEFILKKMLSRLNKKDCESFERIIRVLIRD